MKTTKIKGLTIKYNSKIITIFNSYQMKNIDKMKIIIKEILEKNTAFETKRNIKFFINE